MEARVNKSPVLSMFERMKTDTSGERKDEVSKKENDKFMSPTEHEKQVSRLNDTGFNMPSVKLLNEFNKENVSNNNNNNKESKVPEKSDRPVLGDLTESVKNSINILQNQNIAQTKPSTVQPMNIQHKHG